MQKEEDIQVLLNKGRQRSKLMCFVKGKKMEDGTGSISCTALQSMVTRKIVT